MCQKTKNFVKFGAFFVNFKKILQNFKIYAQNALNLAQNLNKKIFEKLFKKVLTLT